MNPSSRTSLLEAALAPVLPSNAVWEQGAHGDRYVTVTTESSTLHRVLEAELRPDGDYQVGFWYAPDLRGPEEALFEVPPGDEARVADAVARFVRDLLEERLVLALRRGMLRGGRAFVSVEELATMDRDRFAAIYSWRGTFDWRASA